MTDRLSDERLRAIFAAAKVGARIFDSREIESLLHELIELRAKLSAGPVMPVADLYALCEATKEQTYDSDYGFNRGRYFEAKHIAKAVMAAGY